MKWLESVTGIRQFPQTCTPNALNWQLQVSAYHFPVPEPADPSSVSIFIQMFEARVMRMWVVADIHVFLLTGNIEGCPGTFLTMNMRVECSQFLC